MMNRILMAGAIALLTLIGNPSAPPQLAPPPSLSCPEQCLERRIHVRLSQTSYSLNLWKHVRDHLNIVDFTLPVSCAFYDELKVGDQLLDKRFRRGSLLVGGTAGAWSLEVVSK